MAEEVKKATRKAAPKMKVIEETAYNGRQSREYRKIFELGGHKFKIVIDRDSYDFQSSAIGYIWKADKLEWSRVYSIPYQEMASIKSAQPYGPSAQTWHFAEDVRRITDKMKEIVF